MLKETLRGIIRFDIAMQLTSTTPKSIPAPIVPHPAIINGIETCNVVVNHSSLITSFSVNLLFKVLASCADDAMEINEPVGEWGSPLNPSPPLPVNEIQNY